MGKGQTIRRKHSFSFPHTPILFSPALRCTAPKNLVEKQEEAIKSVTLNLIQGLFFHEDSETSSE